MLPNDRGGMIRLRRGELSMRSPVMAAYVAFETSFEQELSNPL
jgi:hypothetical protein